MTRIRIEIELISRLFPEAEKLPFLPRKKKKKLKREISRWIIDIFNSEQFIEYKNNI